MTIDTQALGLAHHAQVFAHKPALTMGSDALTYATLNARVNQLARALRRAGVGVGDAVAAVLHNGFEWFELLNAVCKIGAQIVPVGYRLKGPEISYMVADSHAKLIVGAPDLRDEIDRAVHELSWPDAALWVVGPDTPSRGRAYETVRAAESDAEPDSA